MLEESSIMFHSAMAATVFFVTAYVSSGYFGRNDSSGLTSTAGFFAGLFMAPIVFGATLLAGYIIKDVHEHHHRIPKALSYILMWSPVVAYTIYTLVASFIYRA